MVLSSNDMILGGPLAAAPEPASASLRAICSGRARLSLKAGDAVSLLLAGRAECMIWAGEALTWPRAAVIGLLNLGAVCALATFGLAIWACAWWSFLVVPALGVFYLFWAQSQHLVRMWVLATLLVSAATVGILLPHQGAQAIFLVGIAAACLLLQSSHYLALYKVRATAMSNAIAFEGLERKGIIKVVKVG